MKDKPGNPDTTAEFEKTLAASDQGSFILRLYLTGATERSARAVETVKALCEQHLKGRYELEVVDLYQQPERAAADQIIAVPTLVKKLPLPLRRLIGDLSDPSQVLIALNLKPAKP